jgi:hypothetical protein
MVDGNTENAPAQPNQGKTRIQINSTDRFSEQLSPVSITFEDTRTQRKTLLQRGREAVQ